MQQRLDVASNFIPETVDLPMEPKHFFTKNPAELLGERIQTTLIKSQRGLGFTGKYTSFFFLFHKKTHIFLFFVSS